MARSFEVIQKLAIINKGRKVKYQSYYNPELMGLKCKVVGYSKSGLLLVSFNKKAGWDFEACKDTWLKAANIVEGEAFFFLANERRTNLFFVKPEHLEGLK
ncbi:hypothetical protein PM116P2_00012 [Parabacteroides phage PM116P2]|nr:hypothetical protein PM116P1_00010 [Parabacteroides phage PM116P1]WAX17431.1 hypothetical protein PM116P2_00012 [Parabacteroides phage PM116P2]